MAPWDIVPAAAKNIKWAYNNGFFRAARYISWHYLWGGREYGLLFHDQYFEPAPEVTEALRRLNLKEPWLFDQRKIRLSQAHTLAMHGERLPKDKWTKWEETKSKQRRKLELSRQVLFLDSGYDASIDPNWVSLYHFATIAVPTLSCFIQLQVEIHIKSIFKQCHVVEFYTSCGNAAIDVLK
uniref:Cytochrome b-c1 complex subunit 7 n=1 Tax=Parascaris univalens TaxID=6257 RepID=A0A915C9Y3_PARUN